MSTLRDKAFAHLHLATAYLACDKHGHDGQPVAFTQAEKHYRCKRCFEIYMLPEAKGGNGSEQVQEERH